MRLEKLTRTRPHEIKLGFAPRRCREVMKQPARCVREDDKIQTAARMMRDEDIGFLLVCRDEGSVVGVLTDRDIATRVCAEGDRSSDVLVGSVMTRDVIACRPEDALSRAVALMRGHRLTRIAIVDAVGAPVGVVSLSDLAQYERPSKVGRTLQTISERKYAPQRP